MRALKSSETQQTASEVLIQCPEKLCTYRKRRLLEAELEFIVSPEDKACDDKTLRCFKETNNSRVFHYLGVLKLRICVCVFGCVTNAPAVLQ